MSTQTPEFDLDSLLEGTLDDLADIPESRPYPAGTHQVTFTFEWDKKDKKILYGKMELIETIEQVDATAAPLSAGAETSVRYDLSNEFAQGNLKKILSSAAEHFGAMKNAQLIQEMNNTECVVVIRKIESKKKPGVFYNDIVELQVV